MTGGTSVENNRQHPMAHLRRIPFRYFLATRRTPLLYYHHRYPAWPAVLQVCFPVLLAVRKRNCVWWRCAVNAGQYRVDSRLRPADESGESGVRFSMVHHNCGHPIREAVLQDRQAGADTVWGEGGVALWCCREWITGGVT